MNDPEVIMHSSLPNNNLIAYSKAAELFDQVRAMT
jgi:hypothetical protein